MIKSVWLTGFLLFLFSCSALSTDHEGGLNFPDGTGGTNAAYQLDKPYLIMISVDGFRWDYLDKYPSPAMNALAQNGVRAERLIPVFPTLTFPNHYSLVTGMYPANHGLTANEFPIGDQDYWYRLRLRDTVEKGENYRGEPVWVTAETQGMVAASFFWVGSEADIKGVHPTYWRSYDKKISGNERVDQVLKWLAEPASNRPHLYNLYFENVDDNSHWYGPETSENEAAILQIDTYVNRLMEGIGKLPHGKQVNVMLMSDHGQGQYLETENVQILDQLLNLNGITTIDGGCYLYLHFDQADQGRAARIRDRINTSWDHAEAYLKEDTPSEWNVTDDPRFPDIIVEAEMGYAVFSTTSKTEYSHPGDHGWRPEDQEMHGFFVASGPAFRKGLKIGPTRNVDIHPLVMSILSLDSPEGTDSDPDALSGILIPPTDQ